MKTLSSLNHMLLLAILSLTLIPLSISCSDDNEDDQLPMEIQQFVSKYWPEIAVSDYCFQNNEYHITLRNSATLIFSPSMSWEEVNGRGVSLPSMFLYDQMPEALYEYLETTSNVDNVYSVSRNNRTYTIGLLDSTAVYDISTGKVTN